jgi:hypothetical protein
MSLLCLDTKPSEEESNFVASENNEKVLMDSIPQKIQVKERSLIRQLPLASYLDLSRGAAE